MLFILFRRSEARWTRDHPAWRADRNQSKLIAYGNNRADYTFIPYPRRLIPGVTIVQPDFPELKDGWPFLWFENDMWWTLPHHSFWRPMLRK